MTFKTVSKEFTYFREKEQETNRSPRILPIYYIGCPQMRDSSAFLPDSMEVQLRTYQYADWRELYENATDISSSLATRTLRKIAIRIQEMFEELEAGHPAPDDSGSPLLSRVKASAVDTAAASPFGTPFDLTVLPRPRAFFGRSSDLEWVIEMLTTAPPPHIAALDGAQGIGKTAVAAEAVLRLYAEARFPGGIAVVSCTGMTDPYDVLHRALLRFDPELLPPAKDDDVGLAEEARHLLSEKQALIVLDGIETRLDITRVIEPLSRAGAALLLTSKRPLPVAKARRRTLAPLQIADALDLLTTPSEERRPPNAEHR